MTKRYVDNEILLTKVAELIQTGHTVTLTVRGNSMNPFLRDERDKVTLSPFGLDELQPGEVVLARETGGNRVVLHRIVARQGGQLTLQGDGNVGQTEESDISLVMALMTEAIRKGKRYPTHGAAWLRYSRWWLRLTPMRRWLLALYRRL